MGAAVDVVHHGGAVIARAVPAAFALVLRHSPLVLFAYAATVLAALPVAGLMAHTLAETARLGYTAPLGRGALNPDWWLRLEQRGAPLAAEFLPRTLGFAGTLDTLEMFLVGPRSHAAVLVASLVVFAMAWAAIWAVVLTRFARRRESGLRPAIAAARRWTGPMLLVSATAAVALVIPYVLFAGTNLSLLFTAAVLVVGLLSDLARAHMIVAEERSLTGNLQGAADVLRRAPGAIILICIVVFVLHVLLAGGYGAGEVLGGARVGGWRAVAAAQMYVAGRVVLRLFWGASLLSLTQHELSAAPR